MTALITAARAPHSHELIAAFIGHLKRLRRAESTQTTYTNLLCKLDRDLPEGLVYACEEELDTAIHVDGRKAGTLHLYRAAITAFYEWACNPDDLWLDYNPAAGLARVKVNRRQPRPVTHEQLGDILARANEPFRLWYLLASAHGMRCVEISRADRADVTEAEMWIQGKGGRERTIPTHPAVWEVVKDLPRGPIARTPDGTARATRIHVRERANRHLQKVLGHQGVTMHRLRHWYGTYTYQAGGNDIRTAQELMGHASPNTTAVYVEAGTDRLRAAVHGLPLPV